MGAGKDASEDFDEIGHSSAATDMLKDYLIGSLSVSWACNGLSAAVCGSTSRCLALTVHPWEQVEERRHSAIVEVCR